MAIAFVSAQGASNPGSVTSLAISAPGSIVAGNILIAHIRTRTTTSVPTAPAGWLPLKHFQQGNGSNYFWYKAATGSEPANYTFGWTGSVQVAGQIVQYSGVDTSDPVLTMAAIDLAAVTTRYIPSVFIPDARCAHIYFATAATSQTAHTPATGYTESLDVMNATPAVASAYTLSPPLGFIPTNLTYTPGNTASDQATISLVLRPSGVTWPTVPWLIGAGPTPEWGTTSAETIPLPHLATSMVGDLCILIAYGGKGNQSDPYFTTPSGWTFVGKANATGTNTYAIYVWSRLIDGSESDPQLTGSAANQYGAVIFRLGNVTAVNQHSEANTASGATSLAITGVTTTLQSQLFSFIALDGIYTTITQPASMALEGVQSPERDNINPPTSTNFVLAVADLLSPAGSSGTKTWSWSSTPRGASATLLALTPINHAPSAPTSLQRTDTDNTINTPSFSAVASDPDTSQTVKVRFEIWNQAQTVQIGSVDSSFAVGPVTFSATYSSALSVGSYYVRAYTIDDLGLSSGYSSWVAFNVTTFVTKDTIYKWDVKVNVFKDTILKWDTNANGIKDIGLQWNVNSNVPSKDLTLIWNQNPTWVKVDEAASPPIWDVVSP